MRKKVSERRILLVIGLIAALVMINLLASFVHYRFDLTEEKRYSISTPTKNLLKNLDQPLEVEVFVKGDFPAGFRKLANSIEEFLHECKEYSNGKLQYKFIDPLEGLDETQLARVIDSVEYYFGIPAYTLQAPSKVGDEQTQKKILPGAVIHYKDSTMGINLLQGEKFFGTEAQQLASLYNNIEASLEYKFGSVIQKITSTEKLLVVYALGNGETWGYTIDDAVRSLIKNYAFDTLNLKQTPYIPSQINALVIIKPTEPFNDQQKLKIDQYVMNGGKVFWMLDNMYAEFDSLRQVQGFIAFDRGLNLEDILFNYGVRINQVLLQDMQSDKLPQVSNNSSGQQRLVDWPFFPILNGTEHPISKNLDGIRAIFPTTIDTVEASGIQKTFLLRSSNNSRLLPSPAKIDFEFLQIAPDEKLFTQKNVPVAVLLEGKFRSLFTGRVPKVVADSFAALNMPIRTTPQNSGKMIVVSDGDIAMNQYSPTTGPLPMGMNVFTRYTYANKDFFTNCMEYLVNPSDILQTRSKEYTLRLLDPRKVEEKRTMWQLINIALPILLIIIFGAIYQQIRRRKYAS
jgi:gliding-associated putative ABC transporter substrate-binding component GldG